MALTLLDTFDRANGAPGSNWGQAINAYSLPNIVSNKLDYPQFPSGYWTTPFAANQGVYLQLGGGAESIYLLLRWADVNSGSEDGYIVYGSFGAPQPAEAWRRVNGVDTSLGFANGIMSATDTWMKAEAEGGQLRLYGSSDGNAWTLRQTWSDSTHSNAGFIGLYNPNNTTPGTIDNFGGGFLASPVPNALVPRQAIGTGRW